MSKPTSNGKNTEYARHLRPYGKRVVNKGNRSRAKNALRFEGAHAGFKIVNV